jgi:MFS family permease
LIIDKSELSKQPLWTKTFVFLSISNFMSSLGFQMLVPTLPLYASHYTANSTLLGMTVGILTVSSVITRFFTGAAVDRYGRKPALTVGLIVCLVAMGAYFGAFSIAAVFAVRILHGAGWGIIAPSYGAMAADIVPAARRGEGIGYFGFAKVIADALGPMFGILLFNAYGFKTVLVFTVLTAFIAFSVLPWIKIPVIANVAYLDSKSLDEASFISKFLEKTALFPSFLMLLAGLVYGGIVSFITLFGNEKGIENVGWYFFIYAIGSFLIRPLSGKLFDKKGHFYVLLPGFISSLVGVLLLSYSYSIFTLSIAATFYGIGMGVIVPSIQAWVNNRTVASRRGAANSTFFTFFELGIGGGALIMGTIAKMVSYSTMYRMSSIFLIISIVIYTVYQLESNKTEIQ